MYKGQVMILLFADICKGLHAKYVFSEKPEKRCIYGENWFCMLENGKYAKYAK